MKLPIKKIIIIALTMSVALLSLNAGQVGTGLKTLQGEDTDARELKSLTVEAWEKESWEWTASPGTPISSVELKMIGNGTKRCVSRNLSFVKTNVKCQGLRFNFVYPGNNSVVIQPKRENKRILGTLDSENKPMKRTVKGLVLPGKVHQVSIWVLGRGNAYTLEGWIEDWKGNTHIYKFGSLDFIGWRPLTISIPSNVPQGVDSYPQTKNLIFKKFVIRSTSYSGQDEVVLFFDSLKVLTDVFDVYFDGADMDFDEKDKANKDEMKKMQREYSKYTTGANTAK